MQSCEPYGKLKEEVVRARLSTYIHIMASVRGGSQGKEKEREMARSLINAGTHSMQVPQLHFVHCAFWTNKRILVKHESFAAFSEIISISLDSKPVKVKEG